MVHGKNGVFIVKNRAEFQALMDLLQATRNPSAEILLDGDIEGSVYLAEILEEVSVNLNGHRMSGDARTPAVTVSNAVSTVRFFDENPVKGSVKGGRGMDETEAGDAATDGAIAVSVPAGFSGTVVADEVEVAGGDGGDCIDPNSEPGKGSVATDAPASRLSAANGGSFPRGADGAYAGSTVAHPWIVTLPNARLDAEYARFQARESESCIRFVSVAEVAQSVALPAFVTNAVFALEGFGFRAPQGLPAVAVACTNAAVSFVDSTGTPGAVFGGKGAPETDAAAAADGAPALLLPDGFSGSATASGVVVTGGEGGDCIDPNHEPGYGVAATTAPAAEIEIDGGDFVGGGRGAYARSSIRYPWIVEIPQDGLDALLASFLEREDGSCVKFVLTNDIAGTFTVAASVTNAVLDLGGHSIIGADGVANGEDGRPAVAFASASTVFSVTGTGTLRGGDGADTVTTDRPGFGAPAVAGAYSAASASTVIDGENGVYVVKNKA